MSVSIAFEACHSGILSSWEYFWFSALLFSLSCLMIWLFVQFCLLNILDVYMYIYIYMYLHTHIYCTVRMVAQSFWCRIYALTVAAHLFHRVRDRWLKCALAGRGNLFVPSAPSMKGHDSVIYISMLPSHIQLIGESPWLFFYEMLPQGGPLISGNTFFHFLLGSK